MGLLAAERLAMVLDLNAEGFNRELQSTRVKSERELGAIEGGLDRTGKRMQVAGIGALAFGGALAVGLGVAARSYGEAQKQDLKLSNSIENSTKVSKSAKGAFEQQADALHKVTAADDDAIKGAQALLVQMGLTEQQVLRLTPLVVDLARKKGVDLNTAALAVAKSVDGSSTALKRMGISVDQTAFKADHFTATVDAISQAAGGFATKEGQTMSGRLEILKNQLGDIEENVGQGATEAFGSMLKAATGVGKAFGSTSDGAQQAAGKIGAYTAAGLLAVGGSSALIGMLINARKRFGEAGSSVVEFVKNLGTIEGATAAGQVAVVTAGVVLLTRAIEQTRAEARRAASEATAAAGDDPIEKIEGLKRSIAGLHDEERKGVTLGGHNSPVGLYSSNEAKQANANIREMDSQLKDLTSSIWDQAHAAIANGDVTNESIGQLLYLIQHTDTYKLGLGERIQLETALTKALRDGAVATREQAEATALAARDDASGKALDKEFEYGRAVAATKDAVEAVHEAERKRDEDLRRADREILSDERALADARRETATATASMADAVRQAQDAEASLAKQRRDGALSVEEAQLNLADAQDAYNKLSDRPETDRERQRAWIALQRAQNSLTDATERQAEVTGELNKRQQEGIRNSPEVKAAEERIAQAKQAEADATEKLHDAEEERARTADEDARKIGDAQGKVLGAIDKEKADLLELIAAWITLGQKRNEYYNAGGVGGRIDRNGKPDDPAGGNGGRSLTPAPTGGKSVTVNVHGYSTPEANRMIARTVRNATEQAERDLVGVGS